MRVLFIHGMGRTPLSAWPMLRALRRRGWNVETIFYSATFASFESIARKLAGRIELLAKSDEPYVLIGHSLGGVLARSALSRLNPQLRLPERVFLLGSPVTSVRLARRLRRNWLYRSIMGDCGQLLASEERMARIPTISGKCTAIIGTKGFWWTKSIFGGQTNDGIVATDEVSAEWQTERIFVPIVHSLLPANRRTIEIIVGR